MKQLSQPEREREMILESDSRARMRSSPLCLPNPMSGGGDGGIGKKTSVTSCCSKVGLKRGPWTAEEDELLAQYIKREGEGRWGTLPKKAGLLRCGKSCRLRWMNYLRPTIKRGHITSHEEDLIIRLHRLLGNRWSLIAGRIPGRTDNEIKNYWNTHLKKKLMSQGIDPKTHKPLNSNPFIDHEKVSSSEAANYYSTSPSCPSYVPFSVENGMIHSVDHQLGHGRKDSDPNKDFGIMGISCSEDGITSFPMDDSFSSFLNSLISDEVFNNNNDNCQHQEQEQEDTPWYQKKEQEQEQGQLQESSSLI